MRGRGEGGRRGGRKGGREEGRRKGTRGKERMGGGKENRIVELRRG